jgi:hypothetical protein
MEFGYARRKICGWELDVFDEFGRVSMMVGDGTWYYSTFKNTN